MQPDGQVEVDAPALRLVGAGVQGAADAVRATRAAVSGRLAVSSQAGWAAAVSSGSAQRAWLDELARLADGIGEFGRGLVASAQEYEDTDRAAADGLRSGQVPR